ncbi:MAG: hypothetical protein M3406_04195 [Chloroflexota bacterium]|nr:hypothetical protein [Chloroflexota bacterium]
MFGIDMMPAAQGDCLWIEYGAANRPHRILVDGGTAATYDHLRARIMRLPERDRHFDLLIVSHVDADHIEGVLMLFQDKTLKLSFDDIWFNDWKHLPKDLLGPGQGEMLAAILERKKPWGAKLPWNRAFARGPVQIVDDPTVDLPVRTLDGGMKLTLLSPTRNELARLAPYWKKEVLAAEFCPGDQKAALELLARTPKLRPDALGPAIDVEAEAAKVFKKDTTRANGSSIAVLAEFDGSSVVLAADAHAPVLLKTLPRLPARRRGGVDAFKLPHHGSKKNVSTELVEAIPAEKYLFSSSGAVYHHPDVPAVCRVLLGNHGPIQLIFNYASVHNELWHHRDLLRDYRAAARYPDTTGPGLGIRVSL